jgi:hypothetical protein
MAGLVQIAALLLLAAQDASFAALRTLDGPDLVREGIVAEVIALPPGLDTAEFAARVVDAEQLPAWDDGRPMTDGEATSMLSYKAMTAGDGRGVVVYYSRDRAGPGTVCRLRTRQTGFTDARYRALRWCALQVGVLIPDEPARVAKRRPR